MDVPAYVMVKGTPAAPKGINVTGLDRRGFSKDAIKAIRKAYKIIYRQGLKTDEALLQLKELAEIHEEVSLLISSIESSQKGIIR